MQALACDIMADDALKTYRCTGLTPMHMLHDELIYVEPDAPAQGALDMPQAIMRLPPKWWPGLIT